MNPRRGLVEKELKQPPKATKTTPAKPVFGQEQAGPLVSKDSLGPGVAGKQGPKRTSSTSASSSANVLTSFQVAERLKVSDETVRDWVRRGFLKGIPQAIQIYELEKFKTSYPGELTRAQQAAPVDKRVPPGKPPTPSKEEPKIPRPVLVPAENKAVSPGLNPLIYLALAVSAMREALGSVVRKKPSRADRAESGRPVRSPSGGLKSKSAKPLTVPEPSKIALEPKPEEAKAVVNSEKSATDKSRDSGEDGVPAVKKLEPSKVGPGPRAELPPLAEVPPQPKDRFFPAPSTESTEPVVPAPRVLSETEPVNWLEATGPVELDLNLDAFKSEPSSNPLRPGSDPFAVSPGSGSFLVFDDEAPPKNVFKSAPQPEPPADRFRDEFTAPSHPVTPTEADAVWSGPSPPRDSGASRRPTLGSRAFLAAASRTELTSPPPSDSLLPPTPLAKTMTEGMRRDETEERLAAARANYEQELARVTESEALARRQEVARVRAEFEAQLARQSEQIAEAHSRSVQLQEAVRRGETQQRVWEEKCRASEQQGQTLEQHLLQFRQMQAQRDQQFQNLRTQMLAAQEQRDSQIAILRTQLARLQDSGSAVAELSRLRSEMGELQSRLQDSDQALQAAQRDHQLQAQRWTRELQAAGNWVGKLTEAVAAKDKRIAELESQVTRVPAALTRAGGAESELQAQLMAAKVEVGSLKRSGEVAQLQVVKMESQLQESRAQTASALREVALARDRLEKLIVQEKSPKDAFSPQLGKRLSLNLTDTRLAGMPVEPEKKRDDSLG